MNISKLKEIINSNEITNEAKEHQILSTLAEDKNAILYMLRMLEYERVQNKEMITALNNEVSVYLVATEKDDSLDFVRERMNKFYEKYPIRCDFTNVKGIVESKTTSTSEESSVVD